MQWEDIQPYMGKVALLDLVSGAQICAQLVKDRLMGGGHKDRVTVHKPMMFQVAVEPQDPTIPPGPMNPVVQKVNAIPYGGPFAVPRDEITIDLSHIICVFEAQGQVEKGYLQAASGIEIAGAGALQGLAGR